MLLWDSISSSNRTAAADGRERSSVRYGSEKIEREMDRVSGCKGIKSWTAYYSFNKKGTRVRSDKRQMDGKERERERLLMIETHTHTETDTKGCCCSR